VLLLVAVSYGFASRGPRSLRALYEGAVRSSSSWQPAGPVSEADLTPLPDPVRRYLRRAGVIGRPRVRDFRATWAGRIRSAPDADWMTFTAEQLNTVEPPRRFFLMDARMKGVPVDVLHAFDEKGATMRVRLCSIHSMVDAKGPELTRAETVTLFNDMCLFAPSALIDRRIVWDPVDERSAVAHFSLGSNTVAATLHVDDDGDLVDFDSDDRIAVSADGRSMTSARWSTPISDYIEFAGVRVPHRAQVRWHPQAGSWTYGEFELTSLACNVTTDSPTRTAADRRPTPDPNPATPPEIAVR
jgi:hypothetical protein